MNAILFSANPKLCDMRDAIEHLRTHSKLYFEVKYQIREDTVQPFPIAGFIRVSESGDNVQYVARIEGIEPFSRDHYENPQLSTEIKPSKWLREWRQNHNEMQSEKWKKALIINRIDSLDDFKVSDFRTLEEKPVDLRALQKYLRVVPPKKWAGFDRSALTVDLDSINSETALDSTTRTALIDARIGQGPFRSRVLELWGNRCCVTGSTTLQAIRASHIKPWRESSGAERLDPNNGLPLIATLDALFDAGLISFNSLGEMLISHRLSEEEQRILGISPSLRLRGTLTQQTIDYLSAHRRQHGLDG